MIFQESSQSDRTWSWRICLTWTAVSVAGNITLWPLWYVVGRPSSLSPNVIVGLGILGSIIGFMQWQVMRPHLAFRMQDVGLWVAGGAVGGVAPLVPVIIGGSVVGVGVGAGLLGLVAGAMQSSALYRYSRWGRQWIFVSAFAYALGWMSDTSIEHAMRQVERYAAGTAGITITGAITGYMLVWLMRKPGRT